MRKADNGRDEDVGSVEELNREREVRRSQGGGGDAVAACELDTVADEVEGERGSQERVVDSLRDLLVAEVLDRRLGHRARIAA